MSSATYIYRWNIPSDDLRKEFCKDWYEAAEAERQNGLANATLYHVEPDEFVAIARSSGRAGSIPRGEKWEKYRVAGPEPMTSVIEIRE